MRVNSKKNMRKMRKHLRRVTLPRSRSGWGSPPKRLLDRQRKALKKLNAARRVEAELIRICEWIAKPAKGGVNVRVERHTRNRKLIGLSIVSGVGREQGLYTFTWMSSQLAIKLAKRILLLSKKL